MFRERSNAALRHLGVALIDIDYAIAELAHLPAPKDAPRPGLDTLEELISERDRIRDLAARMAESLAAKDNRNVDWVRRWWPGQIS